MRAHPYYRPDAAPGDAESRGRGHRGAVRPGRGYAAAVFAQARRPWQDDAAINEAIGAAAATAVSRLRAQEQTG